MEITDAMAAAEAALNAVIEGRGDIEEARRAFAALDETWPKAIYYQPETPEENLREEAFRCFKMTLDALEGDQKTLARSYMKVARIKLEKLVGESG